MSNQSADRVAPIIEGRGKTWADPVAATQTLYVGALAMLNTSGDLVRAAATAALIMRGVVTKQSLSAPAGTIVETAHNLLVRLKNSASTDEITRAEIGDNCYVVDDQTVAKTSDSSARPVAGKIVQIDAASGEVWVEIL